MISFCKMHGIGNDFIVINCIKEHFRYSYDILAKFLCDRNFGIGADGVIFIFNSNLADYKMRIFNKDGSEAAMCGNGIRCMAKYIYENIESKEKYKMETNSGIKNISIKKENNKVNSVSVNIGVPIIDIKKMPVYLPFKTEENKINIEIKHTNFEIYLISVGNLHAVSFIENIDAIDIKKYGKLIEEYKYFPNGINVEFVEIINKNNIRISVWEKGVGETLGCGTGASAAGYIAIKEKGLKNNLNIDLKGGRLQINVNEKDDIFLTGPAEEVFKGVIDL